MTSRSPNGANGRGPGGRFAKGNPGGPGNPCAKKAGQLRAALLKAVTTADMKAIISKLVEKAKGGDVRAAREVIDRCVGRPTEADLIERLERLESNLMEREK